MYTFIIKKKGSAKYVAPFQVQFFDNKQQLFDYISKANFFPPAKYTYYVFKLWPNYNQEIFNETIFKKHYKLLYIQEHEKHPSIYPIHYLPSTLKQKLTNLLEKFYKFTNKLCSQSSFTIQRFLEDNNDYPVDMKRYSKY